MSRALACPCCNSTDIDSDRRECRTCGVGLPEGSFDRDRPSSKRRSRGRAAAQGYLIASGSRAIRDGEISRTRGLL